MPGGVRYLRNTAQRGVTFFLLTMADGGGFDPCECVCSHESAMQRLLSMIRNSQSHCTDNQCFGPLSGPEGEDGMSMMWLMLIWVVVAVALFLMRPQSMRGGKPAPSDDFDRPNGNGDSSPPVQ